MKTAEVSLVTVARFENAGIANIARSNLDAAGIQAVLDGEHHINMDWMISNAVGGVKLLVRNVDFEQAKAVLENMTNADDLQWPDSATEVASPPHRVCPNCGSSDTSSERMKRKWIYLSILLLGIPLPFLSKHYVCESCDHRWKP